MSFASLSESRPWICARPPPMPLERLESVKSICGNVLISRSRTIAKCCGCWRSFPRIHSSRVIRSNLLRALARELHRHDRLTARRPGSCRSRRACRRASGPRRSSAGCRRVVLEEVVPRPVGRDAVAARTGAHDGALAPHVTTTMPCGTAKSSRFGGSLPPTFASASSSVPNGPETTRFVFGLTMYQASDLPSFTCDCTCARSAYSDAVSTGWPWMEIDGPRATSRGRRARAAPSSR